MRPISASYVSSFTYEGHYGKTIPYYANGSWSLAIRYMGCQPTSQGTVMLSLYDSNHHAFSGPIVDARTDNTIAYRIEGRQQYYISFTTFGRQGCKGWWIGESGGD